MASSSLIKGKAWKDYLTVGELCAPLTVMGSLSPCLYYLIKVEVDWTKGNYLAQARPIIAFPLGKERQVPSSESQCPCLAEGWQVSAEPFHFGFLVC